MTVTQLIDAIQARLPTATVSMHFRDGVWSATITAGIIALHRKGKSLEEACTRLLDSVMQLHSEENKGAWRRTGN